MKNTNPKKALGNREFYNKYAPYFPQLKKRPHSLYIARKRSYGRWASKVIGKRVLDLGCGMGNSYEYFGESVKELVLMDVSRGLIELAKNGIKSKKVKFIVGDANKKIPFSDNYFDVVVSNDTLHHLNVSKALKEANRVLKPDGLLCIKEPLITPKTSFSSTWGAIIPPLKGLFAKLEGVYSKNLKKSTAKAKSPAEPKSWCQKYWLEHPPDYEFTFKELSDLLHKNNFEWLEYKTSWFRIIPFLPRRYFFIKLNYFLSDLAENHPNLKGFGKEVTGIAINTKGNIA